LLLVAGLFDVAAVHRKIRKYIVTQIKGQSMKYLLFIVLLVAVLVTAGCVGGNQEDVISTPTPTIMSTPTATPTPSDPFVGIWEYTAFSGRVKQYTIHEYGSYSRVLEDGSTSVGTWRLNGTDQGTNQYRLTDNSDGLLVPFFYITQNDTVYIKLAKLGSVFSDELQYYNEVFYRPGKTPVLPNVYSSESIVGTWETKPYESRGLSEYQDIIHIFTFKPDGTFYAIDEKMKEWDGYWRKTNDNQYKIKYIEGVHEIDEPLVYISQTNTLTQKDSMTNKQIIYRRSYSTPTAQKTAILTQTPTQSSSSGSTFLSGAGDDVRSFTATGAGLRIFSMSHTGSHNFAVVLKDSGGNYMTLLANEIGSYSGKKSERLTSGTYYLDITADGSWTIDISSM
jgi:hypothetical protein